MKLSDKRIKHATREQDGLKLSDGGGLYIELDSGGGKYWRYKYRFAGKERRISLGVYPETSLAEARERHRDMRKLLEQGIDPRRVGKYFIKRKKNQQMEADQIKEPNLIKCLWRQFLLCIGSIVTGISIFWLLIVLIDDVRGGASPDNFFFVLAMGSFLIAAGTLIFPLYLLSLLAIKFLIKRRLAFIYAAFGFVTGLLGSCFNPELELIFEPDRWTIHVIAAFAGAVTGFFHGHFDVKYASS